MAQWLSKHASLHARTRNAIIYLHINSPPGPLTPTRLHPHGRHTYSPRDCLPQRILAAVFAYEQIFACTLILILLNASYLLLFLPLILRAVVDILSFTFHKIFGSKIGSPIKVIILMFVVLWLCYSCCCCCFHCCCCCYFVCSQFIHLLRR